MSSIYVLDPTSNHYPRVVGRWWWRFASTELYGLCLEWFLMFRLHREIFIPRLKLIIKRAFKYFVWCFPQGSMWITVSSGVKEEPHRGMVPLLNATDPRPDPHQDSMVPLLNTTYPRAEVLEHRHMVGYRQATSCRLLPGPGRSAIEVYSNQPTTKQ